MNLSPQNLFNVLSHLVFPNGQTQSNSHATPTLPSRAPDLITQPLQNPRQGTGSIYTPVPRAFPDLNTDQQNYPFLGGLQNLGAGPLTATPNSYLQHNPNYVTPGRLDYSIGDNNQGVYYNLKKKTTLSPSPSLPDHTNPVRQFNSNAVVANPAFFNGGQSNNQFRA